MNDNILMENYLLLIKSNVEVFVHGTLESTYSDVQKTLKESLLDTVTSQRNAFELLLNLGVYKVENVDTSKINKVLKKINNL